MKYLLSTAVPVLVTVLGISGCAASLVYDRDRPARNCPDDRQQCLQSAFPHVGGPRLPTATGGPGT